MQICGYGLVVEPQPSKLMARVRVPLPAPEKIEVNGTLLTREIGKKSAHIAQSVEHFLGKEEVIGSNPIVGFFVMFGLVWVEQALRRFCLG